MKLNKYETKNLLNLLEKWFSETDLNARNLFTQNEIAGLIKKTLQNNGNWKDKPRGKRNSADNLNKGKQKKKERTFAEKNYPVRYSFYELEFSKQLLEFEKKHKIRGAGNGQYWYDPTKKYNASDYNKPGFTDEVKPPKKMSYEDFVDMHENPLF